MDPAGPRTPSDAALARAAELAREFVAGLPDRPVPRRPPWRSSGAGSVDRSPTRAPTRSPWWRRSRPTPRRAGRQRRAPLLRVRDRRGPAGGGRRRLARRAPGTRTRGCTSSGPPPRSPRRWPAPGSRSCSGCPPASASGSRRARRWRRSPGLAAGRHALLARAGWDVERQGLFGAPELPVVVSDESHVTIFAALQMLGMGRDRVTRVPTDDQGRMRAGRAARRRWPAIGRPALVCAQAGNVNTGGFDPLPRHRRGRPRQRRLAARRRGVRPVGGAPIPARRHLVEGVGARRLVDDRRAQVAQRARTTRGSRSWRDPAAHQAAMTLGAAYYVETTGAERDPYNWVPESSRRARGFAVWAALRQLGRSGVAEMIGRTSDHARRFAAGLEDAARAPGSSTTSCSTRSWSGSRTRRATSRPATPGRTP